MSSSKQPDLFLNKQGPMVPKDVDYRALSVRMYKALKAVLSHEGCGRWTQAPFPLSKRLGCQFCGSEWVSHAPDCLFLRAQRFLESIEQHFKQD